MNEAAEKKEIERAGSELDQPSWSVVSFDACEAAGLTYHAAVQLLAEKEEAGVYGLCVVTDEAAKRITAR
jgi:hypothetical protein